MQEIVFVIYLSHSVKYCTKFLVDSFSQLSSMYMQSRCIHITILMHYQVHALLSPWEVNVRL